MHNIPHSAAQSDPARVLTKAVLRAAGLLGLSGRQLGAILGLSEASVSRLKRGDLGLEPGSKAFELAALLVRVFRALDAITGGAEASARAWLCAPNQALNAVPLERMKTVEGLVDVAAYLDARRAPL